MPTAISVHTAPTVMPVTLDEAKEHLRVEYNDSDDYIKRLIKAATYRVEQYTGQRLVEQVLDLYFDSVPTSKILTLPVAPVSAVSEIAVNGTTLASSTYTPILPTGESMSAPVVTFATAPTLTGGYPLRVRCEVGYEVKPAEQDTSVTVYYGRARTSATAPTQTEFSALSSYATTTRVSGRLQWGADPAGSGTITNFILIENGDDGLTDVLSYSTDPPTSIFANFTAQSSWTHPVSSVLYQVWTATDGIDATTEYIIENSPQRVSEAPAGLKQALLAIIAGYYEARQDWVQGGPPGTYANTMLSEKIMDPYRLQWAF